MSAHSPARILMHAVVLLASFALANVAAEAQTTRLAADTADALVLTQSALVWKSNCGDASGVDATRIRAAELFAGGVSVPVGTPLALRDILSPSGCPAERVASRSIAADATYIYWISGDGRLMRILQNAPPSAFPAEIARPALNQAEGIAACCGVAVDDDYVYWHDRTAIYRLSKSRIGATPVVETLVSRGTAITSIVPVDRDRLVYLDGESLRLLQRVPATDRFLPREIGGSATTFAVFGGSAYWISMRSGGEYRLMTRRLDVFLTGQRVLYSDAGTAHPTQRVTLMTMDARYVFWHVNVDVSGGPLLRLSLNAPGRADAVSTFVLRPAAMTSDGSRVFLAMGAGGIEVLPTDASVAVATSGTAPVFTVHDLSPDQGYGSSTTIRAISGGKLRSIATDPGNPSTLYVASDFAGVWKSTDGARTWRASSVGIRNGEAGTEPAIAVDDRNSRRVLYLSTDSAFRTPPDTSEGGVYLSEDAGSTWRPISIGACDPLNAGRVRFADGIAYMTTRCGIARSTSADLRSWQIRPFPGTAFPYEFDVRGGTMFACAGSFAYRSAANATTWTDSVALSSPCAAIVAAPLRNGRSDMALALTTQIRDSAMVRQLQLVDFSVRLAAPVSRAMRVPEGSGRIMPVLLAARRASSTSDDPGVGYDVYATDRLRTYVLRRDGSWRHIREVHEDPWGLAIPSNYDPDRGICRAYTVNDGGVFAAEGEGSPATACDPATTRWMRANSGLHALTAIHVYGARTPGCTGVASSCLSLYLSTAHNELWASTDGGTNARAWVEFDLLGDAGFAHGDPALPELLLTGRNNYRHIFKSPDGKPPRSGHRVREWVGVAGHAFEDGPAVPGYTAVPIPVPRAASSGRFVWVSEIFNDSVAAKYSLEIYDQDAAGRNLSPRAALGIRDSLSKLGASTPNVGPSSVFFLTWSGKLSQGQLTATGTVERWNEMTPSVPGGLQSFWVNPYDPEEIWGMAGSDILVKRAGTTWTASPRLKALATQNSTLRFGCIRAYTCSLQQVLFPRGLPDVRIALMWPHRIAYSADRGEHWAAIDRLRGEGSLRADSLADLLAVPMWGWYDEVANPNGTNSLYVAMLGRGLIRIDGPFSSLPSSSYGATAPACDPNGRSCSRASGADASRGSGEVPSGSPLVPQEAPSKPRSPAASATRTPMLPSGLTTTRRPAIRGGPAAGPPTDHSRLTHLGKSLPGVRRCRLEELTAIRTLCADRSD